VHAFVLQDWTTIRSGGATVTQSEHEWLDLAPYQDVIFWVTSSEASASSGSVTLTYQTSPTKDDSVFQAMATGVTLPTTTPTTTPTITQVFMLSATVPLARYVRWQLSCTGNNAFDATFRVLVAANSPGM
jgi:hypothetical protein